MFAIQKASGLGEALFVRVLRGPLLNAKGDRNAVEGTNKSFTFNRFNAQLNSTASIHSV